MPRGGSVKDLRWFNGPPKCFFHFLNAYSEGDKVHVDVSASSEVVFPFMLEASGLEVRPEERTGAVERWTFDLSRNDDSWQVTQLAPGGDMPRVADKDAMSDYEIGYYQTFDPRVGPPMLSGPVGAGFNTVVRLNVKTGQMKTLCLDPRVTVQEHVHIPSKTPGHEGYLAFVADLHDQNLSEAVVISAEHPESGPICRIKLPLRLRTQVHGTWVEAGLIEGW